MNTNKDNLPSPLQRLTADEMEFRQKVRRFAEDQVRPLVNEIDTGAVVPDSILEGVFKQGFMGILVPKEYGGMGGSFFKTVLAIEEIADGPCQVHMMALGKQVIAELSA